MIDVTYLWAAETRFIHSKFIDVVVTRSIIQRYKMDIGRTCCANARRSFRRCRWYRRPISGLRLFMNDRMFVARIIFVYKCVSECEGGWCDVSCRWHQRSRRAVPRCRYSYRSACVVAPAPLRQRLPPRRYDATRRRRRAWRHRFLERALDDLPDVYRYSITCAYVLVLNPLETNRCWEDHGYVSCCLWVSDSRTSDWFQQRRVQVVTRLQSRGARCRTVGSRPPQRKERSTSSIMPPARRPGSTLEYVSNFSNQMHSKETRSRWSSARLACKVIK